LPEGYAVAVLALLADLGIAPCFAILRGLLQAVPTTVMIEANPTRNQIADLRQRIDLLRGFL